MSRRELLAWGANAGVAMGSMAFLAACAKGQAPASNNSGSSPNGSSSSGSAAPSGGADAVKNQVLRTVGLSVTVQDRILEDFKAKSGVKQAIGTAQTFPDTQTRILSGSKDFDVWETIGERIRPIVEANGFDPVPVSSVANWQYARDVLNKPDPRWEPSGQISGQIYTDDAHQAFWMVPTVFNFDSVGFRPDKMEEVTSWADIFDEKHKGYSGLNTDPLLTFPNVMMALNTLGELNVKNPGNPNREEIDTGINYLISKKRAGHFRALWGDFGELVNLMASGEITIADAWQPAVMAVKAQGVPCKYAVPKEGYRAWAIGISVIKGTPNPDAAYAYIDYWLSGPPAITVSEQGYYSPVTTIKDAMPQNKYEFWYEGKPWVGPEERGIKEGDTRDGGSLAERSANIGVWHQWPDEMDYLVQKWDEFLSA